jgi:hypothetical protein
MNNNTTTKTKFTATLVTENDKNIIVALRDETNLSEKELMTLVIATAIAHKDTILAEARKIVETYETDKAARKAAAYEALKAKLAAARAEKVTKSNKTAKSEKPVKASKTAAVTA